MKKLINGQEMILATNPKIGDKIWLDVLGNGTYVEFTYRKHYPERGDKDDDDWEPEMLAFDGCGSFFHYPSIEKLDGYILA